MSDTHSGSPSPGNAAQGGQQPAAGAPPPQSGSGQQQPAPRPAENPNTRGVSPARDAREAAAARQPGQQEGQQEGQQQQTSGSDEVTIGDVKISPDKFKAIMQRQGEIDAREIGLPKDASGYELKVPENFKLPAGLKSFEFNKDDPFLAQARQLAHERKIDQSTFSEVLGLYAGERIAEMTKINTARTAEIAKLGSLAPSRIDAVKTWAHGVLGSDLGGAIEQMLVTAKHVEAFESIINKFSRQGGTPFSQGHREGEPPKGTIPGYANMSFEQKRAAQMNQNPPAQRTSRDPNR
jgi:hypothetical protein